MASGESKTQQAHIKDNRAGIWKSKHKPKRNVNLMQNLLFSLGLWAAVAHYDKINECTQKLIFLFKAVLLQWLTCSTIYLGTHLFLFNLFLRIFSCSSEILF